MTVKALKEGEVMIVYGLAVNYEKRTGSLYKLIVDYSTPTTIIENFGNFKLIDTVNIIVEMITK